VTRPSASVTIAAIATPPGRGGIGVVRVSGAELAPLARQLIGRVPTPRRAERAVFRDSTGREIDEGLALYFPAPRSYTGEDVLELHGHGGPVVMQMLLRRCLDLGARVAEPGEFTRRAFLADKLDLAQAEAVADLIDAATESAARCAVRSLKGEFSDAIHALETQLVELRMLVEATLDFPEEDLDPLDRAATRHRLDRVTGEVDRALSQARQGSLLRTGLHVVLAGSPNVGKSSLLNRLAGEERAIVTPLPGTTRDTVRESIQIGGVPLNIVDTAGLRDTADEIERLGIERTWREIERADLLLLVVEARAGVSPGDEAVVAKLPARLRRVVVHNKIDLAGRAPGVIHGPDGEHVFLSAMTGEGVDRLRETLLALAGFESREEDLFMARERHLDALRRARRHLADAAEAFRRPELFAEELRLAHHALQEITGEFTADDLLGEIFSRFCIGK
jgi:tRNA modification GTPase